METHIISYCEKLGLDAEQRQARLQRFGLSSDDHVLAALLQVRAIKPNLEQIATQFYQLLVKESDAETIFAQGYAIDSLIVTMKEYLLSLGVGFEGVDYFERRIKIGFVHAGIGVNLALYQSAYFLLQSAILDCIPLEVPEDKKLVKFFLKITSFDLSLVVESYHLARTFGLEQRLETMRHEAEFLQSRIEIDALTQVLSRSSILDFLRNTLAHTQSASETACVVMVDIDHFKRVNDQFGHLIGDEVLRRVADRIKKSLRQNDAVGRYGGEEFLIVLGSIELQQAKEIAERIRLHVAADALRLTNAFVSVTISLGIAQVTAKDDINSAIERADRAMYVAKSSGRNRVELA